jgi:hypothetical protein
VNKSACTSRPDCPCMFCVGVRFEISQGRSEKDVLDQIAAEWIAAFTFSVIEKWTGKPGRLECSRGRLESF